MWNPGKAGAPGATPDEGLTLAAAIAGERPHVEWGTTPTPEGSTPATGTPGKGRTLSRGRPEHEREARVFSFLPRNGRRMGRSREHAWSEAADRKARHARRSERARARIRCKSMEGACILRWTWQGFPEELKGRRERVETPRRRTLAASKRVGRHTRASKRAATVETRQSKVAEAPSARPAFAVAA